MTDEKREAILNDYQAYAHAVQTGVAYQLEIDPDVASPKQLRTGVNMALCNSSALAKLLISKGIITEEEYLTAIRDEAKAEKERYEASLSVHYQANITLG